MSIYFTFVLTFFLALGVWVSRVLITLYALKLGAQSLTIGALAALFSAMPTLLSWAVGRFSDRFGVRWPIMIGTVAGILGGLVSFVIPGLPALFVTAALCGTMFTVAGSPMQTLVGLQSVPQDRERNFSNFSVVVSLTGFLGPLLTGFSFDHGGPAIACLTLVLVLLVPAMMIWVWGRTLPGGIRDDKPTGSVRLLLSEAGLWRVLATSSLVIAGIELFQVYIPIYGNGIGLSASEIGILLAAYSLAAFVIRFSLPWLIERLTMQRVLAYSFLIGAAGFLVVPFFKSVLVLCLISFLFGLGMGCGQPITLMMTYSTSTQGRSGEAMGLRVTVNNLTRVVGQLSFGSIAAAWGLFSVFWGNGLLLALGWALSQARAVQGRHKE